MTDHMLVLSLAATLHSRDARGIDFRVALTLMTTCSAVKIPVPELAHLLDSPLEPVQASVRRLRALGIVDTQRDLDHAGRGRSNLVWIADRYSYAMADRGPRLPWSG